MRKEQTVTVVEIDSDGFAQSVTASLWVEDETSEEEVAERTRIEAVSMLERALAALRPRSRRPESRTKISQPAPCRASSPRRSRTA